MLQFKRTNCASLLPDAWKSASCNFQEDLVTFRASQPVTTWNQRFFSFFSSFIFNFFLCIRSLESARASRRSQCIRSDVTTFFGGEKSSFFENARGHNANTSPFFKKTFCFCGRSTAAAHGRAKWGRIPPRLILMHIQNQQLCSFDPNWPRKRYPTLSTNCRCRHIVCVM